MVELTKDQKKELIARRTARFFRDGDLVNLGIGMPTMVAAYIPEDVDVWFQSENGVVGLDGPAVVGSEDEDMVDASGRPSKMRVGACCFDSFSSFCMIRGGHVDATVLGAFQVDARGNLANWVVPGKTVAGMGGAMDLVSGARRVLVTMEHCDKAGKSKILKECTLPLTAMGKVSYVITELCVIQFTPEGPVLLETAPGVTVEDVVARTEAELILPAHIGCMA